MSHREPRHNLPARRTSFIGREHELTEVARRLGQSRAVTLVGSPGVGKTRLALELARDLVDTFPDGIWLVELAALAEPALVPQVVASTLGLAEQSGRAITVTLEERFQAGRHLLLLDNCEHLIEACAALADSLLRSCPDLRLLATSREPLRVDGEITWLVKPLATPDAGQVATNPGAIAHLMAYGSVELFVERASAALPTFVITEQNVRSVARICAHLDGIPLALELAAARTRALTVDQIERRLDDRFGLLSSGNRSAVPHHQTLRGLLEWSYGLLTEPEQVLQRRLSVFVGGWTLEAAGAVCADRETGPGALESDAGLPLALASEVTRLPPGTVLDALSGLVDKSLVLVDQRGREARYGFLETVREYGREKLEQSLEGVVLHDRHRDWCLRFAEQAEAELRGPDHVAWLDRLEAEHDNLRAALSWSLAQPGGTAAGLRLAGALVPFWETRGYSTEGIGWLEAALAAGGDLPAAPRARGLSGLARLATFHGETERPQTLQHQALALYRALGDTASTARSLRSLGMLATRRGQHTSAGALFEESLALFEAIPDDREVAIGLLALGWLARSLGENERATLLLEEGCGRLRALGDNRSRWSLVPGLNFLGLIACAEGDYERANALLEEGLALNREVGVPLDIGWSLGSLALVACEMGHYERAMELYRDSVTGHRGRAYLPGLATSLEGLARLALRRGQAERSARLYGAAAVLRDATNRPLSPAERAQRDGDLIALRADLAEAGFAAAWAEGQRMPLDQAIACALDPTPSPAVEVDRSVSGTALELAPAEPGNPLTRREREVAALVTRGRTNRQIAAELVISERTVDGHVASILSRLGFSTRAQIAAWTVGRGLDSSVAPST